jgi:hypothetical protein
MTDEQLIKEFQQIEDNFNVAMISNSVDEIKKCITSDWVLVDSQGGIIPQEKIFGVVEQGLLSLPPERNQIMKSCRDVSFEFIQEGYEVINRYSRMSFNNSHPKIYCLDDLGAEQFLKYYGNECNIMA